MSIKSKSPDGAAAFWYRQRYALAAALLGAVFFLLLYGVRVIVPTSTDWILNLGSDPSQHYLGWEFYRQSEVRLPFLGMSYATVYPFRTSIIYTDSIPLLALFFKGFSSLLPERFQYLGMWGLFCFMAQGFFGQKIVWCISGAESRGTAVRWGTVGSSLLFLLYPVLTVRMFGHTALAGNWLILMGIWLWLCCKDSLPKACFWWGLMGILCAGIHQYYLPMLGILVVGYAVSRLMQGKSPALALLPILSYCCFALAELFVLGAFSGNFADTAPAGWFRGADPLSLFIPGLYSSWEVDLYMGTGVILACVLAAVIWIVHKVRRGSDQDIQKPLPWLISAVLIAVLSLFAAASNSITIGGVHLGELPMPDFLLNLWQMFSVCGRLGWVAGYLLLSVACGLLLRYGHRIGVAALAVCIVVQAGWISGSLMEKAEEFHQDPLYQNTTILKDNAWQTIAQDQHFQHLAFASYDIETPAYWPLVSYAADNGWTVNCFYLAHIQYDLMLRTVQGELNNLSADTLYVFLEGDALNQARLSDQLHFYRIDGILVGSVDPLPLPEAEQRVAEVNLARSTATEGGTTEITADRITIQPGEMISTNSWQLNPGVYTVTIQGSGLDHSYIHSGYQWESQWVDQDIVFLTGKPDEMVFQFTLSQPVIGWSIQIHTLDDTPVVVTDIEVSAAM